MHLFSKNELLDLSEILQKVLRDTYKLQEVFAHYKGFLQIRNSII